MGQKTPGIVLRRGLDSTSQLGNTHGRSWAMAEAEAATEGDLSPSSAPWAQHCCREQCKWSYHLGGLSGESREAMCRKSHQVLKSFFPSPTWCLVS